MIDHPALIAAYRSQLIAMLPEGPAYDDFRIPGGGGWKLLTAKASLWAMIHARIDDLISEMLPWSARHTLGVREIEAGLPDSCTAGRATTIAERQAAVLSRWTRVGFGHRIEDFEGLAADLGYAVTVTQGRPFRCGGGRCGVDGLNLSAAGRYLRIVVHGPRRLPFRCGLGQCGLDPLLKIQVAEDLECVVRKIAHSHVSVQFIYQEA